MNEHHLLSCDALMRNNMFLAYSCHRYYCFNRSVCCVKVNCELCTVVSHHDLTSDAGYYTAIVKENDSWLMCDDQKVLTLTSLHKMTSE